MLVVRSLLISLTAGYFIVFLFMLALWASNNSLAGPVGQLKSLWRPEAAQYILAGLLGQLNKLW